MYIIGQSGEKVLYRVEVQVWLGKSHVTFRWRDSLSISLAFWHSLRVPASLKTVRNLHPSSVLICAITVARILFVAITITVLVSCLEWAQYGGEFAADYTGLYVPIPAIIAAILLYLEHFLPARLKASQEKIWRRQLAAAQLALPVDADPSRRHEVANAANSADAAAEYLIGFLGPLWAAMFGPIVVLVVMNISIPIRYVIFVAIGCLVIPLILMIAMRNLRAAGAGYGRSAGQLARTFITALTGIRSALTLNATAQERGRIVGLAQRMRQHVMGLLYKNQALILITDGSFGVLIMTTAAAGAIHGLITGSMSVPAAFGMMLFARLLITPVNDMGRTFYTGMSGKASLARIQAALDHIGQSPSWDKPEPVAQAVAPTIELEDVSVYRGEGEHRQRVLQQVNAVIPAGQRTVIMGPSGSGKTSLGLVLAGLLPYEGRITVDGREVTLEQLRETVAYVPQQATLFSGTVAQNIDIQDLPLARGAVQEAAHAASLTLPLDTPINQHRRLSGGQAARVALARAQAQQAGVLLLDEVTANLDPATARQIHATVARLGATVIEITHRSDEAESADVLLYVADGMVQHVEGER